MFDHRTAYAVDYQYMEGVVDGLLYERDVEAANTGRTSALKCTVKSVASSELAAVAVALGIAPDDTIITCWLVEPDAGDPSPRSGDAIVIDDLTWVVLRVIDEVGGQWRCIAANPGSRDVQNRF